MSTSSQAWAIWSPSTRSTAVDVNRPLARSPAWPANSPSFVPVHRLVRGDEVALGEDQEDLVSQIGEAVKKRLDRRALTVTTATLAVVDEVLAQQPFDCAEVAPVDRLGVEAPHELLVRLAHLREARRSRPR